MERLSEAQRAGARRMRAWCMVAEERARQITDEGFTTEHDEAHVRGELAIVAALFAASAVGVELAEARAGTVDRALVLRGDLVDPWPADWHRRWDKRGRASSVRLLTIAGALILAELERQLRHDADPPDVIEVAGTPALTGAGLRKLVDADELARASAEGEAALHRAGVATARAKQALVHYFDRSMRSGGLTAEGAAEIEAIVDDLIEAAVGTMQGRPPARVG